MVDAILATRNRKKFLELRALMKVSGVRWHSLDEFPDAPTVEENGRTFRANAVKKALQTARGTGLWVLADDSGLEIDALGKAPGVRSARFGGRHGDDEANNGKVLRMLDGVPARRRTARYRCALALASPTGVLAVTDGAFEGRIATAPAGARGFGYDPLFVVPRLNKTVAQLPTRRKQRISHRGKAARAMRRAIVRLLQKPSACPAAVRAAG